MARSRSIRRIEVGAAATVSAMILGGFLVPSPAMAAGFDGPSATVTGAGTSGTVSIPRPADVPADAVPTTTGLNAARQLLDPEPATRGHSGTTYGEASSLGNWDVPISDRRGVTMVRVDSISYSPDIELDLELELYDSFNGGVSDEWRSAADGPFDRIDIFLGFGELRVTPTSRYEAEPGFWDLRATVVRPGGLPLTLARAADGSLTGSWSNIAPATDYLATVSWGPDVPPVVVEVASSGPRAATAPIAIENATIEGTAAVGGTLRAVPAVWDTPNVTTSYRWMLRTGYYETPDTLLSTEPELTLVPADRRGRVYLIQEAIVPGQQTGLSVTEDAFVYSESWTTATLRSTAARPGRPVVADVRVTLPGGVVPTGQLRVEVDGRVVQTVPLEASARGRLTVTVPGQARGAYRVVVRFLPAEGNSVAGSNSSARRLIVI